MMRSTAYPGAIDERIDLDAVEFLLERRRLEPRLQPLRTDERLSLEDLFLARRRRRFALVRVAAEVPEPQQRRHGDVEHALRLLEVTQRLLNDARPCRGTRETTRQPATC